MATTLKDIAKLAGVSESTVSLALNDKAVVNEKTREYIKSIATQMGYLPNSIAKSLAQRKSNTIGLVVPDIENPYFSKLIRCTDEILSASGYNLIVATSNDSIAGEQRIIENFISKRVEGVLIAPVSINVQELEYISRLENNGIRYIFVSSYYQGIEASWVMTDLEEGSFDLVHYLLELGHREILFLAGDVGTVPSKMRLQGYNKALQAYGLPVNTNHIYSCGLPNFNQAYVAMNRMIEEGRHFDAVITINDVMALGAFRAVLEHQIRVPEEISIAGYDNVIYSSIAPIPITTVEQDISKMSAAAVELLIGMIAGEQDNTRHILQKPRLIKRESTGPARKI